MEEIIQWSLIALTWVIAIFTCILNYKIGKRIKESEKTLRRIQRQYVRHDWALTNGR